MRLVYISELAEKNKQRCGYTGKIYVDQFHHVVILRIMCFIASSRKWILLLYFHSHKSTKMSLPFPTKLVLGNCDCKCDTIGMRERDLEGLDTSFISNALSVS
jgi:hypothetical protein